MRLVIAALAFSALLTSSALAQSQPRSCSEGSQMCKAGIARLNRATLNSASCDSAFAQCMKTGVWNGPATNRSYPVTKK
jgi:hypothetical protein